MISCSFVECRCMEMENCAKAAIVDENHVVGALQPSPASTPVAHLSPLQAEQVVESPAICRLSPS